MKPLESMRRFLEAFSRSETEQALAARVSELEAELDRLRKVLARREVPQ